MHDILDIKTFKETSKQIADLDIMTPQQIAKYVQVHVKTVYEWIKSGELVAFKISPRSWRIERKDVDNFLQSRKLKFTSLKNVQNEIEKYEDSMEKTAKKSANKSTRDISKKLKTSV